MTPHAIDCAERHALTPWRSTGAAGRGVLGITFVVFTRQGAKRWRPPSGAQRSDWTTLKTMQRYVKSDPPAAGRGALRLRACAQPLLSELECAERLA